MVVVSVISTSRSRVCPAIHTIGSATTAPTATPPTITVTSSTPISGTLAPAPPAIATSTAKATAATPSFKRLSDSTSRCRRLGTATCFIMAMTDTGSVAAISTPNSAAPIQLQPATQCMPTATTPAASATPSVTSASNSGNSRRKGCHGIWIAASNTSGGRKMEKMRSGVSGA